MATRSGDSLALVKRIRALNELGWRAEQADNGNGYKIYSPNTKRVFTVHMTYSDVRHALSNLVQELDEAGLTKDEQDLKGKKLKERRAKVAAGKAAADKKIADANSRAKQAVVKAAGPYLVEPEPCDLAWMTKPHPAPWMRWMYVDAKAAAYILEHHNTDNRNLNPDDGHRHAAVMVSGQWHLTHQGVAFDTRGILQDAQHRFTGIVLASEALNDPDFQVPFAVFVGMPPENFTAIDEGRLRTAAQMLHKAGEVNSSHLGTVIRTVIGYESENPRQAARRKKIGNVELFQHLETDPDQFRTAVQFGTRHYKKTGVTPGALGAAYYLIRKANGPDNAYVEAFFGGFAYNGKHNTNLRLPDDDPRAVLLNKFSRNRVKPIEAVFWFIHSWNNLVKGHHPRHLAVNENTDPPRILVCKPGQGVTPRALFGEIEHT